MTRFGANDWRYVMDALKLLKEQHDEVKELLKECTSEETAEERKMELFEEIADNLAAHAQIEEKIFYPAAYIGELKDLLKEAVEEHLSAKRVLADLLEMDASDENFDAKVKVLKEQIEHHVEEEEGDLFKKVRKALTKDELEVLGTEMETMFETLIQGEPRKEVPAETGEAAPLS
jgi:chemotaxis methyl-accepting protein methylase